jgi:RNA polymerase sigma-70 factor (ECF subfamily)
MAHPGGNFPPPVRYKKPYGQRRVRVYADTFKKKAKLKALTDEELILRVQKGETACFDILVDRFKVRLYNYLFRMVQDPDEAEEIAQETFVKAYIHADKYKTIAKFSTWLYTIGTNLVRNRIRSKKRAPQLLSLWSRGWDGDSDEKQIDIVDPSRTPDELSNDSELSEMINRAIAKIPEKYRTSFVLREINQLSYEEIAAATGLKLGTVRSRINRARNYFRKLVEPILEKGIDF